jgi:hypothetical protein
MSEKAEGRWGEPKNFWEPVNRLEITLFPFLAVDNRLYFGGMAADRSARGIYVSHYAGGRFSEPEKLDGDIFGEASSPCVSPDNRTLVVHSPKSGGFGSSDLSASSRTAAGAWGPLINLGSAVNTAEAEANRPEGPKGAVGSDVAVSKVESSGGRAAGARVREGAWLEGMTSGAIGWRCGRWGTPGVSRRSQEAGTGRSGSRARAQRPRGRR